MKISKKEAREFLVHYHELIKPRSLVGKEGIMSYFKKVGSIQFDPLQIIDMNSNLVLQSRVKNYKKELLNELLYKDRLLIDDWDKNLCIYPVTDWPYFSRYRKINLRTYGKEDLSNHKIIDEIKETIKTKGPVSSLEIDNKEKVNWFWNDTNLAKAALESLYFWGKLVIHHKEGLRKYYYFAENVLPKSIYQMEDPNKELSEFFQWVVKRRIGSVGLLWNKASDAYLGIYFLKTKERTEAIANLVKGNELIELEVEGINYPFYIRSSELPLLKEVRQGLPYSKKVSFIAPLDNLIWDRKLIKELFDFDYKWEVYKPAKERMYGYYVLPVLYGDTFIARFEPVFEKKTETLVIKNWWWEEGITKTTDMIDEVNNSIQEFADYLQAKDINWLCSL